MKIKQLLLLTLLLTYSGAHAESGTNFICANEDDQVKMTAIISDGNGLKVGRAVIEHIPTLFPEMSSKRKKREFKLHVNKTNRPSKTEVLSIGLKGSDRPEILITTDPTKNNLQTIYDETDPVVAKSVTFKAKLTIPSEQIQEQEVTCTETKWQY